MLIWFLKILILQNNICNITKRASNCRWSYICSSLLIIRTILRRRRRRGRRFLCLLLGLIRFFRSFGVRPTLLVMGYWFMKKYSSSIEILCLLQNSRIYYMFFCMRISSWSLLFDIFNWGILCSLKLFKSGYALVSLYFSRYSGGNIFHF